MCRFTAASIKGLQVIEAAGTVEKERREGGGLTGRLRFAGLDADDAARLRDNRNQLLPHVKNALRDLFQRLQTFPEASRNFDSEGQIDRLYDLTQSHWDVLTDARFDSLYAERVKVLTDTESRIGLDPRWHIASHAVVLEHIIAGVIEDGWPRSLLGGKGARRDELLALVRSLIRTAFVDLEISNSLRFNQERLAHKRALSERETELRSEADALLTDINVRISTGDFATPLTFDPSSPHAGILAGLNEALAEIARSLGKSGASITEGAERAARISSSASATAVAGTEAQEKLDTIASAVEELASKITGSAQGAEKVEAASTRAKASVLESGKIVGEAISAMSDIEQSAERIGQIIGVIDEIAFQTNLLALNAGIEAARAGESGRGFAVVAQEVRALAQRSADAAREIKDLVTGTKAQVDSGVAMVNRTRTAIGDIAEQVSGINDAIAMLARETGQCASDVDTLSGMSLDAQKIVRQSVGHAQESVRETDELKSVILELGDRVRAFRVHGQNDHANPRQHTPQPRAASFSSKLSKIEQSSPDEPPFFNLFAGKVAS